VTDDQDVPTLLTVGDRLSAAGLSDDRIVEHLGAGRLRVDGQLVEDLDATAPAGSRIVMWGSD